MIKSISIKSFASYDENGILIDNCKKVNFIYGPNGSGKSTISNFLRNQHDLNYANSSVSLDSDLDSDIIVYNRAFREDNLLGDIDGVFTLGDDSVSLTKEIDELKEKKKAQKKQYEQLITRLSDEQDNREASIRHFQETTWRTIYKKFEKTHSALFEGYKKSKEKFAEKLVSTYKQNPTKICSLEDITSKMNRLFSSSADILYRIDLCNYSVISDVEQNAIWQTAIVGNDDVKLSQLIKELGNSDWVNQGRKYINGTQCPFCQQHTIDEDFLHSLNRLFDQQYNNNIKLIEQLFNRYSFESIFQIIESVINNDTIKKYFKEDIDEISKLYSTLQSIVKENNLFIDNKLKEPSRKIILKDTVYQIKMINELIISLNSKIDNHNAEIDHIGAEKEKLIESFWEYLVDANGSIIDGFIQSDKILTKKIEGLKESIKTQDEKLKDTKNLIIEKQANTTSIQPTIDEINRLLLAYGFSNFKIVKAKGKNNCYQIERPDGTLAKNTLSEGEETFIAFLYFMQLTKGSTNIEKISNRKIVVIDDPICSLDSTVLYIVSSMVRDLIHNIRNNKGDVDQLFVLTHNAFFHKEATFLDAGNNSNKDVKYWVLKKEENITAIKDYGEKNPISTSYELLWESYREDTNLITVQNTMRRILENYFGMLGNPKKIYSSLKNSFETVEEKRICDSLFSWINDGSHAITDDLFIDSYSEPAQKYRKIFEKVFEQSGHGSHYRMMMKIS